MTSSAATAKQRQQIVDFGATSAYVSAEDISGKQPMVDTGNVENNWIRTVSVERAAAETGVLVMVWVVAVLGNTLVCIVINRSRRLQSTTNYFVVSLAAADLVLSLIVCPFAAAQEMIEAGVGQTVEATNIAVVGFLPPTFSPPTSSCKFVRFVEQLAAGSIALVFVAISVDRFYAIVHPLKFAVTRGRAQRLVLCAWALAAAFAAPCCYFYGPSALPPFIYQSTVDVTAPTPPLQHVDGGWSCTRFATETVPGSTDGSTQVAATVYVAVIAAAIFVIPSSVVGLFYVRVGRYIWRVGINGRPFQRTTNPVQRAKVKMVKMLMTLNVASVGLMVPYYIVQLIACSSPTGAITSEAHATALWMLLGSAAARPVVYVTMNTNFRRGCKEVMCMSAMRCYRRHAYTITTTSTLAKKNHVGIAPPSGLNSSAAGLTTIGSPSNSEPHQGVGADLLTSGSWPGPPASITIGPVYSDGIPSPSADTPETDRHGSGRTFSFRQRWKTTVDDSSSVTATPSTGQTKNNRNLLRSGSAAAKSSLASTTTAFDNYSSVLTHNEFQQPRRSDPLRQPTTSAAIGVESTTGGQSGGGSSRRRSLNHREARTPYSTYV